MELWIRTYTGVKFDLINPTPEMVNIDDIAHALAFQCRFNGHTRNFYSVAQHSVLVSRMVPRELKLEALLHDAGETYYGDIVAPWKVLVPEFKKHCVPIDVAIANHFCIPETLNPLIKVVDLRMCATEIRDLLPEENEYTFATTPYAQRISPWTPRAAEILFLEEFQRLNWDYETTTM